METKIIEAYKQMLIGGAIEESEINAYTLSSKVGISEKEFYQYFSSGDDVARKIWKKLGEDVTQTLNSSELFRSYPPRQKILSYYFTFFEVALNERTFIEKSIAKGAHLSAYKEEFKRFMADLVQEGIAVDDIKERLTLSNYYPEVLWDLNLRLINFWLKDTSDKFTETEKAVEIFSKVPLEMMGHNLFDSIFETVKFGFGQLKLDKYIPTFNK